MYGLVAAGPPQMEEQPVALEMYMWSPNSWVIEAGIARLGAAGAGAGELEQRLLELAAADSVVPSISGLSATLVTQYSNTSC